MGDRHQFHRVVSGVEAAPQVIDGELAALVVVDDLDDGSRASRDLEERNDVAGVLRTSGEDAVTGAEPKAVERHVPGPGGVLDDRDLVGLAPDQPGDRPVGVLHTVVGLGRCFVAADRRLALQVVDDSGGHAGGWERGAGVVEVSDVPGARRLTAGSLHVERRQSHDSSSSRVKSRSTSHA